jgi:hypothetical protein
MAKPAPPTNVVATVDSNSQISLSWDHDPTWFAFNGSDGSLGGFNEGRWYSSDVVDHFEIQLSRDGIGYKDPSGGPTTVSYSSGQTSYSGTYGASHDSPYGTMVGIDSMFKFRVRAVNSDGSSSWTASGLVYTEPIPPHNPSVSRPDSNTFQITATVQSDIGDEIVVHAREDTGSGYGTWEYFDNSNGVVISGDPSTTGSTVTLQYTTGQTYSGNWSLQEDARYQFRINTKTEPASKYSNWAYADYGNKGNVYFTDDFESGDLSAWDSTNLADDWGVHDSSFIDSHADGDDFSKDYRAHPVQGPDEGTYYLFGDGGGYVQKNLGDLSSESDVIVKCAMATSSMDSSGENVKIRWYDGSSWTTLTNLHWEYNRAGWVEVTARVDSSLLSSDNRLRLSGYGGSGDYAAWDRVVVSDILHEYTKPAGPTNPQTDVSGEGELTLSWTNNSAFAGDEVFTRVYGSGDNFTKNFWDTPHTWTGLLDGEKYEWYPSEVLGQPRRGDVNVRYRNNGPTTTAVTKLPAPTTLSASNIGPNSADLSWTDNANNEDAKRVYLEQEGSPVAMDFNGSSDYVQSEDVGPSGDPTVTMSVWAKADTTNQSDWTGIFSLATDQSTNTTFTITTGGNGDNIELHTWGNSTPSVPLDDTNWHHYVGVNTGSGEQRFYVDGNLIGSINKSLNIPSEPITIGARKYSIERDNGQIWDGKIRDARIYDRVLSDSEISSIYNDNPPVSGLINYWPLDHNHGGVTRDLSEYANDGSVNGPSLTGTENGMDFERSNNDKVELGVVGSELEFGTGDFSLATKVTFESTGDYRTILELSRYTDSLLFRPDNDQCDIYINGDSWHPNVGFTAGETYELILTRTNGTVELFADGTSQGTATLDGDMNISQESYIGASVHNSSQSFDGEIHYLQMYNKSLSSSERSQIRGGKPVADGLVGYWPLATIGDDGTTPDVSGYGNHGDVLGPTVVGDRPMNAGILSPGTTTQTVRSLLDDTTYEAYVETETEHSTTRDI